MNDYDIALAEAEFQRISRTNIGVLAREFIRIAAELDSIRHRLYVQSLHEEDRRWFTGDMDES